MAMDCAAYALSPSDTELPLLAIDAAAELDAWLRGRKPGFDSCRCLEKVILEEIQSPEGSRAAPSLSGLVMVGQALAASTGDKRRVSELVQQAVALLEDLPDDAAPSPLPDSPVAKAVEKLRDFFVALSDTAADAWDSVGAETWHPQRRLARGAY